MLKRRSHVIKGCTWVCAWACVCSREQEGGQKQTDSRHSSVHVCKKPCGTGVSQCWGNVLAHVCSHSHMCSQLAVEAQMDNQQGREPGSICTSVVGERSSVTRICRHRVLLRMTLRERAVCFWGRAHTWTGGGRKRSGMSWEEASSVA